MPTPHNAAQRGEIAKNVLMPGDPLRAKFIADTFLKEARLVNEVRGMLAYTGEYCGNPVTVMGGGMGMPSIGIYSYELFTEYDVDSIIRVGSAGAYSSKLDVFDVLLADSAYSESSYAKTQNGFEGDVILPSEKLNEKIKQSAQRLNIPLICGRLHSSDVFYRAASANGGKPYWQKLCEEKDCLAVEMESFALFHNAAVTGKQAACLVTISDSFVSQAVTTAQERQTGFAQMVKIALGAL